MNLLIGRFTHFFEAGEGIGVPDIKEQLFPNPLTMLVQICATVVLFFLCKKLLWDKAREILAKRQQALQGGLDEANKLKEEASLELVKAKKELDEAKDQSKEIIDSARKEANNLKGEIVESAKREAQNKLDQAEEKISQRRNEFQTEMHDEMVNVAMAAVSKLLEEKATSDDDAKAVDKYIKEVKNK